jgi:hypothetical protein
MSMYDVYKGVLYIKLYLTKVARWLKGTERLEGVVLPNKRITAT